MTIANLRYKSLNLIAPLASAVLSAGLAYGPNAVAATSFNDALSSNGGVASQSSTLASVGNDGLPQVAERAIDGDTNGDWYSGKITHTDLEPSPWWQVTLGHGANPVDSINVWNRTDCCASRLDPFNIYLLKNGSVVWSSLGNQPGAPESFLQVGGIVGDTVRIQLNQANYLSLAEVQVNVSSVPEPGAWALWLAGLGVTGAALRRRRA
jgi:MYXO-CTERM domain-containing protein